MCLGVAIRVKAYGALLTLRWLIASVRHRATSEECESLLMSRLSVRRGRALD